MSSSESPRVPTAAEFAALPADVQRSELQALGVVAYKDNCAACHHINGEGRPPTFPPLRGQVKLMGDCAHHARIVLGGLTGPLAVDGLTYNGTMPSHAHLDDVTLAAILTYERTSWGNDAGLCLPAQVASQR